MTSADIITIERTYYSLGTTHSSRMSYHSYEVTAVTSDAMLVLLLGLAWRFIRQFQNRDIMFGIAILFQESCARNVIYVRPFTK